MITSFGKSLRKLRIDNGEILKDMAEKLNVTSSFLSAIENGKKKIPDHWLEAICTLYALSESETQDLEFAFAQTNNNLKIPLQNLESANKQLAFSFARKLNNLDSADIEALQNILERKK